MEWNRGDMEHRWGQRRAISRTVQLETPSGIASRGRITNVSISGAFIVSALSVPLFSYIQVHFTGMLHGKRTRMSVEGHVVRKEDSGFGIEWREFAPETVRALVMVPPFRMTEPPAKSVEWEPRPEVGHPHAH